VIPRISADVPGFLPECIGEKLADLAGGVAAYQAIVEIGSYQGRSTCYLASGAPEGVHVWAVDAWDLPKPDSKPGSGILDWFSDPENLRSFHSHVDGCGYASKVHPVRALSVEAAAQWQGPPIGLLFIDGDHSYEAVAADWASWTPHMVGCGKVAFDDARRSKFGVNRFLHDLGMPTDRFCDSRLAVVQT